MTMTESNGDAFNGPHVLRPRFVTPLYYHSDTDSDGNYNYQLPGIVHSQFHIKVGGGLRRASEGAVSPEAVNVSLASRRSEESLRNCRNQQSLVEVKVNSSAPPRPPPRHKRGKMRQSANSASSDDEKDVVTKPESNPQIVMSGATPEDVSSATEDCGGGGGGGSAVTLAISNEDYLKNHMEIRNEPGSIEGTKKMNRRASHPICKNSITDLTPMELPPPQPPPSATVPILTTRTSAFANRSIGIQVSASRYRLRCMPEQSNERNPMAMLGRWLVSQIGLTILLILWALGGAAVFHAAEYPRESKQQNQVDQIQAELGIQLAQDLRIIEPSEPNWLITINSYLENHEQKLLAFVADGYAEGSSTGGRIWTFAGCFLFSISLLTTLGFGAPVPRTTAGRVSAVVFAAVGIPLHLILVLNIGQLAACLLLSLAARRHRHGVGLPVALVHCCCSKYLTRDIADIRPDTPDMKMVSSMPPRWLKLLPAFCILFYYVFGVLVFGVARSRPVSACFLFLWTLLPLAV